MAKAAPGGAACRRQLRLSEPPGFRGGSTHTYGLSWCVFTQTKFLQYTYLSALHLMCNLPKGIDVSGISHLRGLRHCRATGGDRAYVGQGSGNQSV